MDIPTTPPPPSIEQVKAVMYTRFEDVEGYVVSASEPRGVMGDQFKEIGYQFLPDKCICWRLISLALGEYRMIGVPVHIEDSRYPRRAFVFCFCLLVVDNPAAVQLGKVAAQELAEIFYMLETDPQIHLLSDDSKLGIVETFLQHFKRDINDEKLCNVSIEILGNYFLQFRKPVVAGIPVADHHLIIEPWHTPASLVEVSVLTDEEKLENSLLFDVLNACNGWNSVAEISNSGQYDFLELCDVLRKLKHRGMVALIDQPVDHYTRVRLTPKFHSFFDDLNNRQECIAYCLSRAVSNQVSEASSSSGIVSPQAVEQPGSEGAVTTQPINNLGDFVVRMYCRLDGNVADLGEFNQIFQHGTHMSTRHMIVYGLIKGFLRCKTMFPVYQDYETTMVPVLRLCDGRLSWDAVGHRCSINRTDLMEVFNHHSVLKIYK